MSGIIGKSDELQPSLLPNRLKKIGIPRAFIKNDDSRWVLCDIISEFHHEEKQAIYYCAVFDATVEDVAKKIELSPNHIKCALGLYLERLETKLEFFKKIMPHHESDESDLLPISEILFLESIGPNNLKS